MDIEKAKDALRRVFVAFPSFREFLLASGTKSEAIDTFNAWADIVATCEEVDVLLVVDEIVAGKAVPKERHEKMDMLPRTIRQRATILKTQRMEAERTERLRDQGTHKGAWEAVQRIPAGRYAITLGAMSRNGAITPEENKWRMVELLAWDAGGEEPSWTSEVREWSGIHERSKPFREQSRPFATTEGR